MLPEVGFPEKIEISESNCEKTERNIAKRILQVVKEGSHFSYVVFAKMVDMVDISNLGVQASY